MPNLKPVSIIPCNNGFGHIKRCCLIYDELSSLGLNVNIFGNSELIRSFLKSRGSQKKYNIQNIEGLPSGQDYKKRGIRGFTNIFLKLENSLRDTLVISDNYYEPFQHGAKGFLLANFLWSDVEDESLSPEILKNINNENCTLLTSIFAKSYLYNAKMINLFGKMHEQSQNRGYTLVCKGLGDWSGGFEEELELFFKEEWKKTDDPPKVLFIDKNIPYQSYFSNYECKYLTNGITPQIIAGANKILGRPSVGILTDALAYKVPFIPIYASNDHESAHNAQVLLKLYELNGISRGDSKLIRKALRNTNFDLNGQCQIAELVRRELLTKSGFNKLN